MHIIYTGWFTGWFGCKKSEEGLIYTFKVVLSTSYIKRACARDMCLAIDFHQYIERDVFADNAK